MWSSLSPLSRSVNALTFFSANLTHPTRGTGVDQGLEDAQANEFIYAAAKKIDPLIRIAAMVQPQARDG